MTAPVPHPLRTAMEARDVDAMVATLAPDVVFRSPAVSTPFVGREAVRELFTALIASLEEFEYTHEIDGGETRVIGFRARIAGRPVEGVDLLEHDADGRVREITVYARPLSGAAAFVAAIGPRLAAARSPARGRFAAIGTRPLPGFLAFVDAVGARLIRARTLKGRRAVR